MSPSETPAPRKLPSVLFVTSELVGPFKNGGIGTATTGLVETVAAMGCPTTVLYTGAIWHVETNLEPWVEAYRKIDVELIALTLPQMGDLAGPVGERGAGAAYLIYLFVKARHFDIVHFNETLGEGLYVMAAKQLGLAFAETLLVLALHGPTRWARTLNGQPLDDILYSVFDWGEQLSVRSADVVWCPSRYLTGALREFGWPLPAQIRLQQYVMPTSALFQADPQKISRADELLPVRTVSSIEEIVFFGRLEERKGLRVFCSALDRLAGRLFAQGIRVTFLGKPVLQDGESTDTWLERRGVAWQFAWRLEARLGQPEAISYLLGRRLVAVMPSPFDNSPCTIYEALQHGIPFLAAATGGIPELIDPEDHQRVLFEYTPEGLTVALERALDLGVRTARPRITAAENRRLWHEFHEAWRTFLPPLPVAGRRLRYLVMVDHLGRDQEAERTLDSVTELLGDRISETLLLTQRLTRHSWSAGITILDASGGPGIENELANLVEANSADWVLCLAAGTTLVPPALPLLERALETANVGAGILPAALYRQRGVGKTVPSLGSAQSFGFFEGFGFTGGAVLAPGAVVQAFRSSAVSLKSPFLGLVDLVVVNGGLLWPFPEPVFELSTAPDAGSATTDAARSEIYGRIDPFQATIIRSIGLARYRRRLPGGVRKLLLRLSAYPGYRTLWRLALFLVRSSRRMLGRR